MPDAAHHLSDEEVEGLLAAAGAPSACNDVLRSWIHDILDQVRKANPTDAFEEHFAEALAATRPSQELAQLEKRCSELHRALRRRRPLLLTESRGLIDGARASETVDQALGCLERLHQMVAQIRAKERRGAKRKASQATALLSTAELFLFVTQSDKELHELPTSPNSRFVRFAAALLGPSGAFGGERGLEERLAKQWRRLRQEIRPMDWTG